MDMQAGALNDPVVDPSLPREWKIVGIAYSSLSALVFPVTIFIQFFSIFLFDAPGDLGTPTLIAFGILMIPVSIIVANGLMWLFLLTRHFYWAVACMTLPILYPVGFVATLFTLSK